MIFYQYIKGCGSSTTSKDSGIWSWLVWANDYESSADFDNAPSILVNNKDSSTGRIDLGHILTQKAIGQYVENDFYFRKKIVFAKTDGTTTGKSIECNSNNNNWEFIYDANSFIKFSTSNQEDTINIKSDKVSIQGKTLLDQVFIGNVSNLNASSGDIIATGKCQALYFNNTSDIRAKENISIADFEALELINKLKVQVFNYKENKARSIGFIAQDLEDYMINDFSFVDNKEATGENGDFMSIRESKLVYVLWKAIQEQQKEIEELRAQLKKTS